MSDKLKLTDELLGFIDLYEDLASGVSPMCTPEEVRQAIRELRDAAEALVKGCPDDSEHICDVDSRLVDRLRKALGIGE